MMLNVASQLDDLKIPPNNHLEALSGDRQGQHSIRINDQFRICFRWLDNHSFDVEIVDYHQKLIIYLNKMISRVEITWYVLYNISRYYLKENNMAEFIELTTVGEMLKEEFIEPYNLTQNKLANAIFVPPNRIHQIIKGQRRITADTDLRLTKYFGLSQGYFLRYQEDYELRIAKRNIADEINKIQPIQALG